MRLERGWMYTGLFVTVQKYLRRRHAHSRVSRGAGTLERPSARARRLLLLADAQRWVQALARDVVDEPSGDDLRSRAVCVPRVCRVCAACVRCVARAHVQGGVG